MKSMDSPPTGELGSPLSPPSPTTPAPDSIEGEKLRDEKEATPVLTEPHYEGPVHERWNSSTTTIIRYLSTLLAFLVMGVSDASVGVSLYT